jgi:hypothetical protein
MAKDMFWVTVTFSIIISMLILAFWPKDKTEVVVAYDCRVLIGGWHPDFPAKVIEECRKRSSK